MKYFLSLFAVAAAAWAADLPGYVSTIEAGNALEQVFYRVTTLAGSTLPWRKSPAETRAALTTQIAAQSNDARLYYLRAREAELQLDFAAAEADLARYVELAPNKQPAWVEKANYHHRRLEPAKEIAALLNARLFARAAAEAREQLLDPLSAYQAWEAAEPESAQLYDEYLPYLLSQKRYADYEAVLGRRGAANTLERRAALELARGGTAAALGLYDREAPEALKHYQLLVQTGQLRNYVAAQRQRAGAAPRSWEPVLRLFWVHQHAGRSDAAQRVLYEFRQRGGSAPLELARLYEAAGNVDEAAHWYSQVDSEEAMAGLALLLLNHAGQAVRYGAGDLGMLADIGSMDRSPGWLNGVLSLVFNTTYPAAELANEENRARPYFHRAKAAELVTLFDSRFPNSARRPALRAKVVEAFSIHGVHAAVIREGRQFLSAYPKAPERPAVALLMAGAYAAQRNTVEEFKVYDTLLGELGSQHPQYKAVLDRAVARYVSLKRMADALALQRREIDRNPADPLLYERLAGFLEQNRMGAEIEAVYRRAMAQFPDKSWSHKLARWYLRGKMNARYDALSREVAGVFSGTDLEEYLRVTAAPGQLDAVLYRNVNNYALARFPHHVPFVKNLVDAYGARATANPAEQERLLRGYWIYDDSLRQQFFALLARSNRLEAELTAVQALLPRGEAAAQARANPAAALWVAEAEAWRSHWETAAPYLRAVAASYPADISLLSRTAAVHRSLGQAPVALEMEGALAKAWPRQPEFLTRLGEIHADREQFAAARPWFDRVAQIAPGKPEAWLESATLHWDYLQYDDAIRQLTAARQRLNQPTAFAFEMGAIYENKGQMATALREYVAGALAADGDSPARRRLLRLARREKVEALLASLPVNGPAVGLRVALLEAQGRREDLAQYLTAAAGRTTDRDVLARFAAVAARNSLPAVQRTVMAREIALTADPLEALRLRLERARWEESQGNGPAAQSEMEALLSEHPKRLAVVRAAAEVQRRTGNGLRSVAILRAAADAAHPALQRTLRLEAGRQAEPAVAQAIGDQLLEKDPADAEAIALKAAAYAAAGDDRGLAAFYRARLASLPDAAQVAGLRAALLPALTRLRDFAGAIDQYIELARRSPEDETLLREAARYAADHGAAERLLAYFVKAEADSPRDARWALVRARLETEFGNYPAALQAWSRAVALRPERTDLLAARGDIETRLARWDEAAATYQKLYELSYRNPVWLERAAETRARQGRMQDAVALLRQAYGTGRPNPQGQAERLESWGLLEEALAAGPDLATRARLLTRLRRYEQITGPEPEALAASARAAGTEFTPEEKGKYAAWLEARGSVEAALSGEFFEVAAKILYRQMMAQPGTEENAGRLQQLYELQMRRGRFAEAGQQLEAYWKVHPPSESREQVLRLAGTAYRRAGEDAGELRALAGAPLEGENLERYLQLRPTVEAGRAEALANYGLRKENAALALRGILAAPRPPLWKSAYRALTGLYFGQNAPEVKRAFTETLGPETIGAKLAAPKGGLAGDTWFYYAARYADYLGLTQDPGAAAYRPALVENRSASAKAFFAAGDYRNTLALDPHYAAAYARLGDHARALEEFGGMMDSGRYGETWWDDVRASLEAAAGSAAGSAAGDALLEAYVRRNGSYRLNELVRGVSAARLERLAQFAAEPAEFLAAFAAAQPALWERAEALAGQRLDRTVGETREAAAGSLQRIRTGRLEALVAAGEWSAARQLLGRFSPEQLEMDPYTLLPLRLRVAAQAGQLAALLASVSDTEALRAAAGRLRQEGAAEAARQVLTWAYERELAAANPPAASYMGLAQEQPARAVALLDRLVMTVGEPYAQHAAAASLLLELGRPAEALRYAVPLAAAQPWSAEARLLLGRAKGDEAALVAVAIDRHAPYALRLRAAAALNRPVTTGARELDLLAARQTSPAEAEQPYAVTARLRAAEKAADAAVKVRLLRGALAIDPAQRLPLFAALQGAPLLALAEDGDVPPETRERVGDAYLAAGQAERAIFYFDGNPAKERRAKEEVARRTKNESRRPVVGQGLEQPHVVRVRLEAGAQ
ncbi:MAG: hypothetical protein ACK5UT_14015 [Acidobacteriota bacterium]